MPLTLQEAQTVIADAHELAGKLGARVTVAIVDEGGHLQALGRMDGAPPLSSQIAETKAASAALFRRDGASLRQMQEAWPAFFTRRTQRSARSRTAPHSASQAELPIRSTDNERLGHRAWCGA